MRKPWNNFTGGEWTPFLDGRADLQKYDFSCLRLENFRPLPWGGASLRGGLEYFGMARYQDRPCRLIPFKYSTALCFVIELGDGYARFWKSTGLPLNGFTLPIGPLTIVTPWAYTDLAVIQFRQINDEIRFTHPNYPPQTMTFSTIGGGEFTIEPTDFKYPVLLDQNIDQTILLNVAATSGATTLTASQPMFEAAHVGSQWELQHLRDSASAILDLDNSTIGVQVFSSTIEMQGDWTFDTSQFWWGALEVQRSQDGGTTWNVIRSFQAKSGDNYSTSGTEQPPNIGYPSPLYRIAYTQAGSPFDPAVWTGSPPTEYAFAQATLSSEDAYIAGVVTVTGYVSATVLDVTVVLPPASTDTTYLWSEGAFSGVQGYPSAIGFYEQRLLYAGTASRPNTLWGSVSGDFDNFQYSSDDDGAVAFQPAVTQQNQTVWLASLLRIHMGTTGEEIIAASGNLDEALTPSNITMRAQSYYGSGTVQPLLLQNSILFVERNGLRVREMRELSPYIVPTDFVAPDLTLMAEHMADGGIISCDFGKLPDPLVYFIRPDGQMPVMTYNREQNINAWARYVTAGNFESVASIYGSPADEVFVSVARPIGAGGATVRTIEGFTTDPAKYASLTNNLLLDCGAQFLVGQLNPFTNTTMNVGDTQLTGLTWLAGQNVTIVVDGGENVAIPVSAGGVAQFPANLAVQAVANVGLPYIGYLTPMKPAEIDQTGSSQGLKGRIKDVVIRVRSSVSLEFSGMTNPTDWNELPFRSTANTLGEMTPLSGGLTKGIADFRLPQPWPDGNSFSAQFNIRQAHPFPLTILGVFADIDFFQKN